MPTGFLATVESFAGSSPLVAMPLAPPSSFRAAEGVRSAWPIGDGPFGRTPTRGGSAAQRAGRRYEKKALAFLHELLGGSFRPSQWFKFVDASGLRFCQVDGLLQSAAGTTIFEVKTTFTADAWWQLRRLYEPVVKRAFVLPSVSLVVVCKNFDPAIPFPEAVQHTALAAGWQECLTKIGVFQWRP